MSAKADKPAFKPEPAATQDSATAGEPDQEWDEVAEASWESFPASDPPAWTRRSTGGPQTKQDRKNT